MTTDDDVLEQVLRATGARAARLGARVQTLWSGYGEVRRVLLEGAPVPSVIVKRVQPPRAPAHRRGWNTQRSHLRKLRSYDVEMAWYRGFAARCDDLCRVPRALSCEGGDGRWTFVLEDLDAAGFALRRQELSVEEQHACLDWLASFHGRFMGEAPEGLWEVGTYWHLQTRPDELQVMRDARLRAAAPVLDRRLNAARFQTLVHGDAKVANFCFAADGRGVAAVDFQYVGGGVGIRDVAYFLGSCLDSNQCEARAEALLEHYLDRLGTALASHHPDLDAAAVAAEWRHLHPLAWADFHRFLDGWAPEHPKLHAYAHQMTDQALRML